MSNELEAFLEYLKVSKALSATSIEAYEMDLLQVEALSKKPLIALDTMALFSALSHYSNKRTLNRKLSSINSFFSFCHKKEFLQEHSKMHLSKVPKKLPQFLSFEEIQAGLSMIDRSSWIGLRDYALLLFLYATGTRISECLAVKEEDIEEEWLHIRHAKGDKERMVPVAPVALNAVQVYLEAAPFEKEFLWVNYQGSSLSRISAYKITQKYLGVSPHVLRHSYATSLITGGADLRVVQELLGHASLMTTQIYTHIQKQDLKDTVDVYHPMAQEQL